MLSFLTMLGLLVASATGSLPAAAAAAPPAVRPVQQLAALLTPHAARHAPRAGSTSVRVVAPRRPITGEQTVLPVVGHATDATGRQWLRVRLPGRPNGRTGWIMRAGTVARATNWRIVIDVSRRNVVVYRGSHAVRTFDAVVGKPSTPTPAGEFFVEESIALSRADVGAPFALALSARSTVYREFEGGPGQVALHGLANVGGVPGTAVSHGCVRLTAAAMTWLVGRIGPGVPVTVSR